MNLKQKAQLAKISTHGINLKSIVTEKAVMKIESENLLMFETELLSTKQGVKEQIEKIFGVKVESIRVQRRENKKIMYVKLNKKTPAIDIAAKLGLM